MTTPLQILQLWQEKKLYLELELAKSFDPSQTFALHKHIKECDQNIARLQAQTNQTIPRAKAL